MNVVRLFPLGATTNAKDYLRNFNLLEAKVHPDILTAYIIMQYTHKYISVHN